MGPIQNIKGVQRITGCLATLSQFISCLGERGLPLYQRLKKSDLFEWTAEAQKALDMVKQFLTKPPVLVPPYDRESLLLYISATTQVVSSALIVEREEEGNAFKVQRPVYFISEVLSDSKTRYS